MEGGNLKPCLNSMDKLIQIDKSALVSINGNSSYGVKSMVNLLTTYCFLVTKRVGKTVRAAQRHPVRKNGQIKKKLY